MRPSVLVIDDDDNIRTVLGMRLEAGGYEPHGARDGAEAERLLVDKGADVALCDLRLGNEDGLDVMRRLREIEPELPVLIITAHGSIPNAIEAMKEGAAGYLTKPLDRDELFATLERLVKQVRQSQELAGLRRALDERGELMGIVGRSPAMRRVFEVIERVAPSDSTVTILGENGTGKERVARAIHQLSPRANRPFVAVNCGALPDTLLQSELFGYRKGAFTDARSDKDGLFQAAHRGTLLLDEIGEVSAAMQRALLRALDSGTFTPLGADEPVQVDVRVLASTNQDLELLVEEGRFREDLYYRLNVVSLWLPPLRERAEDILPLAETFLSEVAARAGKQLDGFTQDARRALLEARWNGNARELRNAVERAVVLSDGSQVSARDLALLDPGPRPEDISPLREARESWERDYLTRLMQATRGNVSAAARAAGKYRADLYGLLKKHSINPGDYK